MEQYTVDTAPDQIVRWLKTEVKTGRRPFDVRATRAFAEANIASFEDEGISEDTDVSSVTAIGTLEVRPGGEPKGWMLQLRAEDALGNHVPEDHSVTVDAEEIDLEDFEAAFITPMRADIDIVLYAETPDAKRAFDMVLLDIVRDRQLG